MIRKSSICFGFAATLFTSMILAENLSSVGGDVFVSDANSVLAVDVPRDVFATGFSVSINGAIGGDAHAAGFNVTIDSPVNADLYATGANITVRQSVGDDLNISGFNVDLADTASIGGNARVAAGTVKIDAPISGSLVVSAGTIHLNSQITGDVQITAADIEFGSSARIDGTLTYSGPHVLDIPDSVIAPARVVYKPASANDLLRDARKELGKSVDHFWPALLNAVSATIITLAFLMLVATLFLAIMPERIVHLRHRASHASGRALLFGCLGLATTMGLIPVSGLTLVGLPFIPILILVIILLWLLGYVLGAYLLSFKLATAFSVELNSLGGTLVALFLVLLALVLLNFIPIAGWLINLVVMLYGAGIITLVILDRMYKARPASLPEPESEANPTN